MYAIPSPPAPLQDMEAVVWLENYLQTFRRILVLISHSQDFLNNVCTNIIFLKVRIHAPPGLPTDPTPPLPLPNLLLHPHPPLLSLPQSRVLTYFSGNYDTYMQTRHELEEEQTKRYQWEQDQIAHMKEYIARFGHGSAKLARQAQSKEKTLAKMVAAGLTQPVERDSTLSFKFNNPSRIPPPVLQFQVRRRETLLPALLPPCLPLVLPLTRAWLAS
jgi:ATP-binding cassette subfamily F protein 2